MNQQNAFERIAELEAKLATVEHERDELLVRWLSTRAELIDAKYGVEPSGLPNAEARIRELEGKLKIATENCAAMTERLAAAEAVCELLASSYLVLPGQLDRDLLKKWRELKEKP